MQEVKVELHFLSDWVESGEASIYSLECRISALERFQISQATAAMNMQLLPEDLAAMVAAAFHKITEAPLPSLEIGQVHRNLGPK